MNENPSADDLRDAGVPEPSEANIALDILREALPAAARVVTAVIGGMAAGKATLPQADGSDRVELVPYSKMQTDLARWLLEFHFGKGGPTTGKDADPMERMFRALAANKQGPPSIEEDGDDGQ